MTLDGITQIIRLLTSRPVTIAVFILTAILWSATFFYVIPKASDGWFGPTVSIAFGLFGALPALIAAAAAILRLLRGQPITPPPDPGICPCCGQPLPSAPPHNPAAH